MEGLALSLPDLITDLLKLSRSLQNKVIIIDFPPAPCLLSNTKYVFLLLPPPHHMELFVGK